MVDRLVERSHVVELAGCEPLVARAAEHLFKGRPVEALHLVETVMVAEPDHAGAIDVRLKALERLLERSDQQNLSETMWLRSEIEDTRAALED